MKEGQEMFGFKNQKSFSPFSLFLIHITYLRTYVRTYMYRTCIYLLTFAHMYVHIWGYLERLYLNVFSD